MNSSNLQIENIIVGPLLSNCYIAWEEEKKQGIVIDPGDDSDIILKKIKKKQNRNKKNIDNSRSF